MVPDKFNMVDMGGIDLIMMQGEAVPGLYDKLMAAISNCRYQCCYNWLFDGILIPPTYVQIENDDDEVFLNEGVSVTSDDVIHIYSLDPGPVDPEIIPLLAEENGVYNVPAGKDGFNPVTVDVPSYTPVINPITITENGTYNAPAGVDGYSPVVVSVEGGEVYSFIPALQPLIDTGISVSDLSVRIKFRALSTSEGAIFGSNWSTTGFFLMVYNGKFRFHSGGYVIDMENVVVGRLYDIECGYDYCVINGTEYSLTPSVGNTGTLHMFTPASAQGNVLNMLFQECGVYTNENLVQLFKPANSNGLYETISETVFNNTGSGTIYEV